MMNYPSTSVSTNRITWIDLTKGVAIWLVLWGHAITELMPHSLYENPAYLFIYSFHMPLFMLVSGFFAEKSFHLTWKEILSKKTLQLITPTFSFGILWYLILAYKSGNINVIDFIKLEINGYWFLKSLFICYIISYICWKFKSWKWIVAILVLVVFLSIQIWNITIYKTGNMLPFFYIGILIKEKMSWIMKNKKIIFLISAIAFSALFPYYSMNFAFPTKFFSSISTCTILGYLYYLSIALMGSLLIIALCMIIDSRFNRNWIVQAMTKAGSLTLGIYLWQKIVLENFLPIFLQVNMPLWCYNYIFCPIIATISLIACYYLTNFSHKNQILSIFLWQRKVQ